MLVGVGGCAVIIIYVPLLAAVVVFLAIVLAPAPGGGICVSC